MSRARIEQELHDVVQEFLETMADSINANIALNYSRKADELLQLIEETLPGDSS